jgi:CRP/FNR family transcriptional regulator
VSDKVRFLSRLNLFDGMSHEEIERVARELTMRRRERGESIGYGDGDRVYLLKQGRVRMHKVTRDGHEVTTAVLVPGQLFGLGSLFGRAEPVLAECLDECYVCEAGAQDFLGILAHHPLMMAKVMMAMAKQIFRLQETVEHLALEPARSRLARHLLTMAETGTCTEAGRLLPAETQEEMAKTIASTRETVARALSAWRRQGVVAMDGRRVVLRDPDRLRAAVSWDGEEGDDIPAP